MTTASKPLSSRDRFAEGKPLWARAIAEPAQEFGPVSLPVLSGSIPPGLRGSLYRNGPGRLERGGERVAHWFDGDGGILGVHFTDGGATGLYRYVKTKGFLAEAQADHFLYPGYGQKAPGPFWRQWGAQPKNAANTSVLALPDKLLALWEGGNPHALDLETLETWNLDDLGVLNSRQPFSAHPKRDPQTGDIYNFGITYGKTVQINLYRCDPTGQIRQQTAIPLKRLSLVHDFALAGPYLIFFVPPLKLQLLPVLLGLKSFSESFQWQPQHGTEIIVVDRASLQEVSRFHTDPWFQWHVGNGYQAEDGTVRVSLVRHTNFQTNEWLRQVPSGAPHTPAKGTLGQVCLDPIKGKVLDSQECLDLECDFPVVSPRLSGLPARHLYVATKSQPDADVAETFDSLACVDLDRGDVQLTPPTPGCYPMEPIYAPDSLNPEQGWILTVVFDGLQDRSTVQIFSAQHLEEGSVCVLALPQIIPFGFHGTWRPQG
jgi:all-trans-8'-apo-beta-carotenal 15,15'-oxygenase